MPDQLKRRQLKIEPLLDDENALQQLIASLVRIEAGLSGIHELLSDLTTTDDRDRPCLRVRPRE